MQIEKTNIDGVVLITPRVIPDDRGVFFESYNEKDFQGAGIADTFIQDNLSTSKQGTLRGLHFQHAPYEQAKLVRVVQGEVFDVAVDIRRGSSTFGKWVGYHLSEQNHQSLFIPAGCAHGFYVISTNATFTYKCSNYYNSESNGRIIWNDLDLHIEWPLVGTAPILSKADAQAPTLRELNIQPI